MMNGIVERLQVNSERLMASRFKRVILIYYTCLRRRVY